MSLPRFHFIAQRRPTFPVSRRFLGLAHDPPGRSRWTSPAPGIFPAASTVNSVPGSLSSDRGKSKVSTTSSSAISTPNRCPRSFLPIPHTYFGLRNRVSMVTCWLEALLPRRHPNNNTLTTSTHCLTIMLQVRQQVPVFSTSWCRRYPQDSMCTNGISCRIPRLQISDDGAVGSRQTPPCRPLALTYWGYHPVGNHHPFHHCYPSAARMCTLSPQPSMAAVAQVHCSAELHSACRSPYATRMAGWK